MKEQSIKVTLSNGIVLEGPPSILIQTAKSLGEDITNQLGDLYWSESKKAFVNINDMPIEYRRNAFCARLKKKVEELLVQVKPLSNSEFLSRFTDSKYSLIDNDPTLLKLYTSIKNSI